MWKLEEIQPILSDSLFSKTQLINTHANTERTTPFSERKQPTSASAKAGEWTIMHMFVRGIYFDSV
jgi:hypothetical protein